jgi:hypothetical protein
MGLDDKCCSESERGKSSQARGPQRSMCMPVYFGLQPAIALIAGIIILVYPKILNYVIGMYLILVGLLGLFGGSHYR